MTAPAVRYVQADVRTDTGPKTFTVTRVGWLPGEGWFCTGCKGKRSCEHVEAVKEIK